jgi:hypothetical protein
VTARSSAATRLALLVCSVLVALACQQSPPSPPSKWLHVAHVDSGPHSTTAFDAWLDTTVVVHVGTGRLAVWTRTENATPKKSFATHWVIVCNEMRWYYDAAIDYDSAGRVVSTSDVYAQRTLPPTDSDRLWVRADPRAPRLGRSNRRGSVPSMEREVALCAITM